MNHQIWRLSLLALILTSCGAVQQAPIPTSQDKPMTIQLSSSAFAPGQSIPAKYSCTGREISPPLAWSDAPANTRSFALIVEDPDAPGGTWVHWVIYNISPDTNQLPEAIPNGAQLTGGGLQGRNSSGNFGYNGPCPPAGTHRYVFKIYALDAMLTLAAGADKAQLLAAMQGHLLAQGELLGTFAK
jgi:Raf kinase inhibitor-like YbhB/YbcL family protein